LTPTTTNDTAPSVEPLLVSAALLGKAASLALPFMLNELMDHIRVLRDPISNSTKGRSLMSIPPKPNDLLAALKKRDDDWQELVTGWIAQLEAANQPITAEQELIMRDNLYLHAFNRITSLTEALATYDCGNHCSYLRGKYLLPDGSCPRTHEGGCGRVANQIVQGYLPSG
jgi:hypothetical protein